MMTAGYKTTGPPWDIKRLRRDKARFVPANKLQKCNGKTEFPSMIPIDKINLIIESKGEDDGNRK